MGLCPPHCIFTIYRVGLSGEGGVGGGEASGGAPPLPAGHSAPAARYKPPPGRPHSAASPATPPPNRKGRQRLAHRCVAPPPPPPLSPPPPGPTPPHTARPPALPVRCRVAYQRPAGGCRRAPLPAPPSPDQPPPPPPAGGPPRQSHPRPPAGRPAPWRGASSPPPRAAPPPRAPLLLPCHPVLPLAASGARAAGAPALYSRVRRLCRTPTARRPPPPGAPPLQAGSPRGLDGVLVFGGEGGRPPREGEGGRLLPHRASAAARATALALPVPPPPPLSARGHRHRRATTPALAAAPPVTHLPLGTRRPPPSARLFLLSFHATLPVAPSTTPPSAWGGEEHCRPPTGCPLSPSPRCHTPDTGRVAPPLGRRLCTSSDSTPSRRPPPRAQGEDFNIAAAAARW